MRAALIDMEEQPSLLAPRRRPAKFWRPIDAESLREYIMDNYLVMYVQIGENIHLLAIRHQRQLSLDFESHWGAA